MNVFVTSLQIQSLNLRGQTLPLLMQLCIETAKYVP